MSIKSDLLNYPDFGQSPGALVIEEERFTYIYGIKAELSSIFFQIKHCKVFFLKKEEE